MEDFNLIAAFGMPVFLGLGTGIGLALQFTNYFAEKLKMKTLYLKGCIASAIIIFFTLYAACIDYYGFLFGVGLGWIPSLITAIVFCWVGPIAFLILICAAIFITYIQYLVNKPQ